MSVTARDAYDENNVFARILRGEIPADVVYEDEHALAIRDIAPQAPVHVLVMPKARHRSFEDFAAASPEAQGGFLRAVKAAAAKLGLAENGYRLIANHGVDAGQEVAHFHLHLFGGAQLGRLVRPRDQSGE